MSTRRFLIAMLPLLLLTGCATGPEVTTSPSSVPSTSATPSATETPSTAFADPADFTTHFLDFASGAPVDGVDFNSADNNLHCGIFSGFTPVGPLPSGSSAFGGCVPLYYDYEPPRPAGTDEAVGCEGAFVTDISGPAVICNNGAVFMGDGGVDGNSFDQAGNPIVINHLLPGMALSLFGLTCEAVDQSTVQCTVDATSHGFVVSRSEYSEF